jgi:hypothetical protein
MSTKPLGNISSTNKPIKASIPVETEKKINPALKHVVQSDGKDF